MSDSDFDVMLLITMINRESNVSSANYILKKKKILLPIAFAYAKFVRTKK